jgi:hypothetical protein
LTTSADVSVLPPSSLCNDFSGFGEGGSGAGGGVVVVVGDDSGFFSTAVLSERDPPFVGLGPPFVGLGLLLEVDLVRFSEDDFDDDEADDLSLERGLFDCDR